MKKREQGGFRAAVWLWKEIIVLVPQYFHNSIFWSLVMVRNYLKIALRVIQRQKVYSFINISGLAIGLASCILIMLWVKHQLSYDLFHKSSEEIFLIYNTEEYSDGVTDSWAHSPAPLKINLEKDFPEFEEIVRIRGNSLVMKFGDKVFKERMVQFVDPEFLTLFSFRLIRGNKETCLQNPNSVVLTANMAQKYFGEKDPLGKVIRVNGEIDLTVTGITEQVPSNSSIEYDFLIPFITLSEIGYDLESWSSWAHFYYVKIKGNRDKNNLREKIAHYYKEVFSDQRNSRPPVISFLPLKEVYLYTSDILGNWKKGDVTYIYIFSIIALFILLTAGINFMNLATARSANRAREVGLRKVVGAKRIDIIGQFFGESFFVVFVSLVFSLAIVYAALPYFNYLTSQELTFSSIISPDLVMALVIVFLAAGFLSGSYPAIFLSSFIPVKVLKGKLSAGGRSALFRKILVSVQFVLTISLIVGSIVINEQLTYARTKNMGFDKEHLVCISLPEEVQKDYKVLRNELAQLPGVINLSFSSSIPSGKLTSFSGFDWEGRTSDQEIISFRLYTDEEFLKTMKLTLLEGEFFSKLNTEDTIPHFVVNEAFVKATGMTEPVGKKVAGGIVVGILKDFHFESVHEPIAPLLIADYVNYDYAVLKLNSKDILNTVSNIKETWTTVTDNALFEFGFLDEKINSLYQNDEILESTINLFTSLILFVASLGLLGLSSFSAEQRRKEVGIRKVMGASVSGLFLLLVRDYLKLILISCCIAWPLSYYIMFRWLEAFAYRIEIPLFIFPLSVLIALVIALFAVGYQSITAATSNPIHSIKYE